MSIFFYNLREDDELPFARQCSEEYGIPFGYCVDYPSPDNYHLAEGYDAISCTPCDMSRPVVEAFHDLGVKYITTRSIGIDHIDRVRARELGMRVGNVTVGIVGTGKIATAAARQLSGFGCTILYYGHHENEEMARFGTQVSLEELLCRSDAITLHTNATDANHHMIDAAAMEKMKDGVIIVNTARGKLIDTDALIDALERGKVGAAALDVLENENGLYYYNRMGDVIENRQMAVLRSFPNVILSPHTAFYTRKNIYHMVQGCFEAVDAWNHGRETEREVYPD